MARTTLLLIDVLEEILNSEEATLTGDAFALPSRATEIDWQVVIDDDEDVTVILQTAIELTGPYLTIDTITLTGTELSELRSISPVAGKFVRMNITVNVSEVLVIGKLNCKIVNP